MSKIINDIIKYENGNLDDNETISLFSKLIKNGMAWSLQGVYGRMAKHLIKEGYINNIGNILKTR